MYDAHTIVIDFDKTKGQIPDWEGFEHVCENFLQKIYGADFTTTKRSHDKGVDLKGESAGKTYVVQVKCQKNPIGTDPVDAFILRKKRDKANVGIFVSVTGFSEGAEASAKKSRIDLYNFLDFCSMGYERNYKMYMFWYDTRVHFREPQNPKNNRAHSIYFKSRCSANTRVRYRIDENAMYDVSDRNTCVTFEGKHKVVIMVDNKRHEMQVDLKNDIQIDIYKDSKEFNCN